MNARRLASLVVVSVATAPGAGWGAEYIFVPGPGGGQIRLPENWVPYGGPTGPGDRALRAGQATPPSGRTAARAQIPPGFELVDITNDAFDDWRPRLDNCGRIVFSKRINDLEPLEEIFLYDNGRTVQLTNDQIRDALADISDRGTIVWTHDADRWGNGMVAVLEGEEVSLLAPGFGPRVNSLGHLSWIRRANQGCDDADFDVFFYDGLSIEQITSKDLSNQGPAINELDEITWDRADFCQDPWVSDILLRSGGQILQLTEPGGEPQLPDINAGGLVAWGSGAGIELWQEGETTLLTNWGRNPHLNSEGYVSFLRWHDENSTWQVWLYRGNWFLQITDDPFWNAASDINDDGEVVISSGNIGELEIRLLRRIRTGDADFDSDVDSDDHTALAACMTGPERVDGLCACRFLDIDHDGDVDLADFGIFQRAYAGPQ